MSLPRALTARRAVLALLLLAAPLGVAGVALASPAPVAACPPCGYSFEDAAERHGVGTGIEYGEATVRVHENGSATWTVRNRLANASAAERLRGNATLARSVAAGSFGIRYGGGIEHELLGVRIEGETFVMRYRTDGVAEPSVGGSTLLTYFRDDPGAYVYTDLGADRLTVVGPEGTVVARGFGDRSDDGRRTTATSLPRVTDGPFVVFAPADHPVPGLLGALAVVGELWTVVLRNLALFVAIPGTVFLGGLLAIHRFLGPPADAGGLRRTAGVVAATGVLTAAAVLWVERPWETFVSTQAAFALAFGATLVGVGALANSPVRAAVTYRRLLGGSVAGGGLVAVATALLAEDGIAHGLRLGLLAPFVLLSCVALGYTAGVGDRSQMRRTFALVAGTALAGLTVFTPIRTLGGTLFLLVPVLLTILAAICAVLAAPLYRLGGALAAAEHGSN